MNSHSRTILSLLAASALFACKAAAPEAESADSVQADEGGEQATDGESAEAEGEEAAAEDAEAKEKEEERSGPRPQDIVTSTETTFVLDFVASDIGEKTEERCRKQSGDDMKKFADCKRKVQDKLGMPMLKFEEKDGKWWWLTYDRKGSQLVLLHKVEFEIGEQTKNTMTILPKGRDQGKKPVSFPNKVVITLPNDNSIEIDDPTHGRMMYRARVGILEQTEK